MRFLLCLSLLSLPALADTFTSTVVLINQHDFGLGPSPVHATVLPDGDVLLFGVQREFGQALTNGPAFVARYTPTPDDAPLPALRLVDVDNNVPFPCTGCDTGDAIVVDSLFCSGHTLLPDGRVFALSGTRSFFPYVGPDVGTVWWTGIPSDMIYDPALDAWTQTDAHLAPGSANFFGRWYGTATRLASGQVLLTSGYDVVAQLDDDGIIPDTTHLNISVETFDPVTGARQLVSPASATPEQIFNVDYTHVFQFPFALPSGEDVLMFGESGEPVFFDPQDGSWVPTGAQRPGVSVELAAANGASTILLPLRLTPAAQWGYAPGATMTIGGGGSDRLIFADVYDAASGGWSGARVDLGDPRHHPSATILPDGRIFVVGGHGMPFLPAMPRNAVLIDPADMTVSATTSEMDTTRGYHTATVLLPDGRVLVAGGRTAGSSGPVNEQPTLTYFRPDYMDAQRPNITTPVDDVLYDTFFNFQVDSVVSEVVLVALGSMTHSFDTNQRHVEVPFLQTGTRVDAVVVGGERVAPPGHYMLFVLDDQRVPSVAEIVQLTR